MFLVKTHLNSTVSCFAEVTHIFAFFHCLVFVKKKKKRNASEATCVHINRKNREIIQLILSGALNGNVHELHTMDAA
jgi:hypothetical protein